MKNHYFLNGIIDIKNFDPINIKIDEKPYKNIFIYYIGYVTINDLKYVKLNSVNPLYLIFSKCNGYFEEIYENKYLTLVPTYERKRKKKVMKNCGVKSKIWFRWRVTSE